jgi:hypothetical protein
LHFLGVAAFNCGKYEEAGTLWRAVLKLDKQAPFATRYLQQLDEWKSTYGDQLPAEKLPYQYHNPTLK